MTAPSLGMSWNGVRPTVSYEKTPTVESCNDSDSFDKAPACGLTYMTGVDCSSVMNSPPVRLYEFTLK